MNLSDLKPAEGATHRRKIIGRGTGSGHGKTSGRGHKGDKSRGQSKLGFEGGQTPLHRRLPKQRGIGVGLTARGFNNGMFKTHYHIVNLGDLERFEAGTEITPEFLAKNYVIRNTKLGVKILGDGELTKPFTIHATKFSAGALAILESIGGTARIIGEEVDETDAAEGEETDVDVDAPDALDVNAAADDADDAEEAA